MCEATTIIMAASAATAAYQQNQQGKAAQQIAKVNAGVAGERAQDALDRGAEQERRQREEVARATGTQRAAMGSSGVEVGTGTFGNILEETAAMGEQDALTIRANAAREAYGHQTQQQNLALQGKMDAAGARAQAIGTAITGMTGAARNSSMLGTPATGKSGFWR